VSLRLYMDHHVRSEIAMALRQRGVDVLTAEEDGAQRLFDAELLSRATALARVLFSQDRDLLKPPVGSAWGKASPGLSTRISFQPRSVNALMILSCLQR
jgi:hypothetical protein